MSFAQPVPLAWNSLPFLQAASWNTTYPVIYSSNNISFVNPSDTPWANESFSFKRAQISLQGFATHMLYLWFRTLYSEIYK